QDLKRGAHDFGSDSVAVRHGDGGFGGHKENTQDTKQRRHLYHIPMLTSRRGFVAASGFLLAGCAARRTPLAISPAPRLARVRVSPDRVIRTVVGLRPFRPSGFVVRGEKLGEKTVIHNYGHGGAGIT